MDTVKWGTAMKYDDLITRGAGILAPPISVSSCFMSSFIAKETGAGREPVACMGESGLATPCTLSSRPSGVKRTVGVERSRLPRDGDASPGASSSVLGHRQKGVSAGGRETNPPT